MLLCGLLILPLFSCGNDDLNSLLLENNKYFMVLPSCLPNCTKKDRVLEYKKNELRETILAMIASAQNTIDLGVYNFSVVEIFHALVKKVENDNVKLRLLFPKKRLSPENLTDPCLLKATTSNKFSTFKILEKEQYIKAVCPVIYAKLNLLQITYLTMSNVRGVSIKLFEDKNGGLYHHKMMIIDNESIIFGSGNFTYNGLAINLEEFTYLNRKEAKAVSRFTCEFNKVMNESHKNCGDNNIFFTPGSANIRGLIRRQILASKEEILVFVHQFGINSILNSLKKVSTEKGVKVKWLRSGEYCTAEELQSMKKLVSKNFEVRFFFGNPEISQFAHAKFALFDRKQAIFGSGNWTTPAFRINNEYYLFENSRSEKIDSLLNFFTFVWRTHSTTLENCAAKLKAQ